MNLCSQHQAFFSWIHFCKDYVKLNASGNKIQSRIFQLFQSAIRMMIKIAAICLWMGGLGFGLPCLYAMWSLMEGKGIARLMGYPTYGEGPFEKIGVHTTIPLLLGFFLVCGLECVAGWGVWNANKGSAVLSFAIIPVELLFYIGFALPFGPPFLILRVILLFISWSALQG
jgi:hypothetical protein